MPSFNTFFRAAVMLATGFLVVRGWQLYGPSDEQMKSFMGRAIQIAHETWNGPQPPVEGGALSAEPIGNAPLFAATTWPPATMPPTGGAAAMEQPLQLDSAAAPDALAAPPVFATSAADQPAFAPAGESSAATSDADGRLPALLTRLEELGGVEPQLAEWGSSGRLYRFCCRATLADSPSFSRHFESVAAEPLVAVEEVLAKVEAWRTARRDAGPLQ